MARGAQMTAALMMIYLGALVGMVWHMHCDACTASERGVLLRYRKEAIASLPPPQVSHKERYRYVHMMYRVIDLVIASERLFFESRGYMMLTLGGLRK